VIKKPNDKIFERFFLLLILFVSLFLFLTNLGGQYLWQDEAQTALISKTILTDGVPRGYDGKNFFSQELGIEYGKNYIWKWHTWLPFYVVAIFYRIFGISTFTSRLPFALFGTGSVFLSYLLCKAMWEDKKTAFAAALLLAVSVPFLLLSRQCRYYSMAAFFSLWALYSYVKILDGKKYAYFTYVISSVFLFHANYIYCAPLFFTVLLHCLLFNRRKLLTVLLLTAISILINIPWIFWLSEMKYRENYDFRLFQINEMVKFNIKYIKQIHQYIFPLYLLLAIPATAVVCRMKKHPIQFENSRYRSMLYLLIFFVISTMGALSILGPAPFFRYLCPLIPIFIIFTACLTVLTVRIHFSIPIIIIVILIAVSPMKDFIYELTHDYKGPIEGIVRFLNENANDDDTVVITYGDMPLKFYTKLRVVGALSGEDISVVKDAEWVIIRKHMIGKKAIKATNYLEKNLSQEDYKTIILNYPDTAYENREEIAEHNFRTVTNEDGVVIYRKIQNTGK